MKLLLSAVIKFAVGLACVGLLLFLPAGTLVYPRGWLFAAVLFVPMLILGAVLYFRAPDLLSRRLDSKEKESAQRGVVAASGLAFIAGFIVSGLDFRFGWSHMPAWVSALASVVLLLAYAMYAEVMRENAYLSRTVKVEDGQTVVDTGLYGIVRHPMYTATLVLFLVIPLVLGSWYALIPFALYPIVIAVRIVNEEKVLREELRGYAEYTKRVRWRILPFVW